MTKIKSIDRPRPNATKKNIRAVCAAIAEGHTIAEACASIGIAPTTWRSWCDRKPEAKAMHEQAIRSKIELLEEQILTMHEDLSDATATNARIKLRDSRVENRKWFLRINQPGRYSEKQIVGVQEIPTPEETAAQVVVRSEERKLFEQVFGPLDPEPDAEPEKALTVDEWLAMRPLNAPEPEPLQLSSGPHGEQTRNRRYATPDDIVQPERAPQVAETPEQSRHRRRRVRLQLAMLEDDEIEDRIEL